MSVVRTAFITALITCVAVTAVVTTAEAQRKRRPQPACGIKAMPFIVGYEWLYVPVAPPEEVRKSALKTAANKPKQPNPFTVKVVAVEEVEQGTEITLEETAHEITKTIKLLCSKSKRGNMHYLDVDLQSFLFTGEPGGALALELSGIERPEGEHSYVFQYGTLRIPEWIVNVKAAFVRSPSEGTEVKLADGALDLQRIVKRGAPEDVTTELGTFQATPVQIELVGSVTINTEPEPEEFSVPANTATKLWVADNVGIVQMFNSNGHMYQLSNAKLGDQE